MIRVFLCFVGNLFFVVGVVIVLIENEGLVVMFIGVFVVFVCVICFFCFG